MRITIAERFKPYSHRPGTSFILPGSTLRMQIFPNLIRVDDLRGKVPVSHSEMELDIKGPVEDFTVQQDLEKGLIRVWGGTSSGFVRYQLHALTDGSSFVMKKEKIPEGSKLGSQQEKLTSLYSPPETDRLSLGVSKAQDWMMIAKRKNLAEIFPIWHRLGQLVPHMGNVEYSAHQTLLGECRQAVEKETPDKVLQPFLNLFLAAFEEGLSPRLIDEDFQGFSRPIADCTTPLMLLVEGAHLIRSLFVQSREESISILPALPSSFHCGRLIEVDCGKWGSLDLEWTKKKVRRMHFHARQTGRMLFHFQKGLKSYRLCLGNKDRGQCINTGIPIEVEKDVNYWFDNFEQ